MSWISDKIEKFRQMPTPYVILHVTSRSLFGFGLGVLLTTWLPVWTGWIFIGVALVIAIPSARIRKTNSKVRNFDAKALDRLGGLNGGKARAASLTPERRVEIARKAALARWGKVEG